MIALSLRRTGRLFKGCGPLVLLSAALPNLAVCQAVPAAEGTATPVGSRADSGTTEPDTAEPDTTAPAHAQPRAYPAADTLKTGAEQQSRARECLEFLTWPAGKFDVAVSEAAGDRSGCDRLVRFPSAVPAGSPQLDAVVLEWYIAREKPAAALSGKLPAAFAPAEQGAERPRDTKPAVHEPEPTNRPAIVVVHESGRGMTVGRLFARTLRNGGVHTFLIQLPHYGHRRVEHPQPEERPFDQVIRQSVADVRRARDAVAALPGIDPARISLQGTSLGGFVSTTVGSLDPGYQQVFLMLCGGDLHQVITSGRNEAASLRKRLEQAGLKGEELKQMLDRIEPSHIAHRLSPATTWLYSAREDQVVPLASAVQLAEKAALPPGHHIIFAGNHYSAIAHFLPVVMHILEQVRSPRPAEQTPAATSPAVKAQP